MDLEEGIGGVGMESFGLYVFVGRSGTGRPSSLGEAVEAFLGEEGPAFVLSLTTRRVVLRRGLLR